MERYWRGASLTGSGHDAWVCVPWNRGLTTILVCTLPVPLRSRCPTCNQYDNASFVSDRRWRQRERICATGPTGVRELQSEL